MKNAYPGVVNRKDIYFFRKQKSEEMAAATKLN